MRIVILGDANSINVQRLQEGLSHAGAEVYLLSIHIQELRDAYTLAIPTPKRLRLPNKLRYFMAVPAARRLITRLKPDLVIGYFVTGYGTLAALSGFKPLVQVTSGDDILIAPEHPILGLLVRHNLYRSDLIVTWAPHMREAVKTLGFPDTKLFTLPRGIPLQHFTETYAPSPTPKKSLSIISTRSLYSIYKIDHVIQTIRYLRDSGLDYSLTIAGNGPERTRLLSLVHELNLSAYVQFAGIIPNDTLPSHLAKHDFYVSIITTDGVSASLLEAMAAGIFPIVIDNAANRHWIESGKNGLLVQNDNPETLADAIQFAATDLDLRQQAWKINRQLVLERGDLYRNTATYLERFRQLVKDYANGS
jgi:glycosyltransferase involved in cell wall biosynthesis